MNRKCDDDRDKHRPVTLRRPAFEASGASMKSADSTRARGIQNRTVRVGMHLDGQAREGVVKDVVTCCGPSLAEASAGLSPSGCRSRSKLAVHFVAESAQLPARANPEDAAEDQHDSDYHCERGQTGSGPGG